MAKTAPIDVKNRQEIFNYVKSRPVDSTLNPSITIIDDIPAVQQLTAAEIRSHIQATLHTNAGTGKNSSSGASNDPTPEFNKMRRYTKWLRIVTGNVKIYQDKTQAAVNAVMSTVVGLNFMGSSEHELDHYAVRIERSPEDKTLLAGTDAKQVWTLKESVIDEVDGLEKPVAEAITSVYRKLFETWLALQEDAGVTDLVIPFIGGGAYLNALDDTSRVLVRECIHNGLIAALTTNAKEYHHIKRIHYYPVVKNNKAGKLVYSSEFKPNDFMAQLTGSGRKEPVIVLHETDMFSDVNTIGKDSKKKIGILNPGSDRTIGGSAAVGAEGAHFDAPTLEEQLFHRTTLSKMSTDHNPKMKEVADRAVDNYIFEQAKQHTRHAFDIDASGEIIPTSGHENNCLIHASLGQVEKGHCELGSDVEVREFLFKAVKAFDDDAITACEKKNPEIYQFILLMGNGFAGNIDDAYQKLVENYKDELKASKKSHDEINALCHFKAYRDYFCDQENEKTRFLMVSEIQLLALLSNQYILNWTRAGDELSIHSEGIYSPNPKLRAELLKYLESKKIKVPKVIEHHKDRVQAVHLENSHDIHFSRVEWKKGFQESNMHRLQAAIDLHNEQLRHQKPKPDDKDKPKNEEEKPKPPVSNPVAGKALEFMGRVEPNISNIVWSDDEKKKIYRNNINNILYMMTQTEEVKRNFLVQVKSNPINASVVHRDKNSQEHFYTKLDHEQALDLPSLLIENIKAYERLKVKTKPDSRILKQYQILKSTIDARQSHDKILENPENEGFKSIAFARTEEKNTYFFNKVAQKTSDKAPQDPIAMVHRKVEAAKPTHYHLVGLGDLAALAQWTNNDLPKDKHILKDGTKNYRLYFTPKSGHPNQYEMYKCEVDGKGEYLKGVGPEIVTPQDEARWSAQLEKLFEDYKDFYAKKQNVTAMTLHKAGFKPPSPGQ